LDEHFSLWLSPCSTDIIWQTIAGILIDMVSTIECRNDTASSFVKSVFDKVAYDIFGVESLFPEEYSSQQSGVESSAGNLYAGEQLMSVDSLKFGADDATFDASTIQSVRAGMTDSYMDLPHYEDGGGESIASARSAANSEKSKSEHSTKGSHSHSSRSSSRKSSAQEESLPDEDIASDARAQSPMIIQTGNGPKDSDDDSDGEDEQTGADADASVKSNGNKSGKSSKASASSHSTSDEDSAASSDGTSENGSRDSGSESGDGSGSDSSGSGSSSGSEEDQPVRQRRVLTGEQKGMMYEGLNDSLQDALKQLVAQFESQRRTILETSTEKSTASGNIIADNDSSRDDDSAAESTSTGNASIYKNSATMLVKVLLQVVVERVAVAKLPYGVDLFNGADSKTKGSSSKGKRRKARRKGMHKDTAPAADTLYVRPMRSQKREGLLFKRASLGAEGGRMVITGGTSGDYSVASDTSALGRVKIKPKNMTLVLHSLLSVKPVVEGNAANRQVIMALSSSDMHPSVVASVSYSKWKTECLTSDQISASRSAASIDSAAIGSFLWSKLDDNIADWDDCVVRNYQVSLLNSCRIYFHVHGIGIAG
jgi:hypothetical protein